MVLEFSFFLIFIAVKFVQIIKPVPQIKVIISKFSLKKMNPNIVVKINLEKSNGIKLVKFDKLNAFVQQ